MPLDPMLLLSALHPEGSLFSICAFGASERISFSFVTSPRQALDVARQLDATDGFDGVYHCVPNLKAVPKAGRGREADVANILTVWADVDGVSHPPLAERVQSLLAAGRGKKDAKREAWIEASPTERSDAKQAALDAILKSGLPEPSMLVDSGRGWHPYWLLESPAEGQDLPTAKAVNRAISRIVGGDDCFDLARVLKVPGTRNRKNPAAPEPCELIAFDADRRYRLADLALAVEASAYMPGTPPGGSRPAPPPDLPPIAERVRRASAYVMKMDPAISGAGGHLSTWKAALALVRGFALPKDSAFEILAREFNTRCQPPWSEKELWHKIRNAEEDAHIEFGYLLRPEHPSPHAPALGSLSRNGNGSEVDGRATPRTPKTEEPKIVEAGVAFLELCARDKSAGLDAMEEEVNLAAAALLKRERLPVYLSRLERIVPESFRAKVDRAVRAVELKLSPDEDTTRIPRNFERDRLTDSGNAELLEQLYGKDVLYCSTWKKWLIWDGRRWAFDTTEQIHRIALHTVMALYSEANHLLREAAEASEDHKDRILTRANAIREWAKKSESDRGLKALVSRAEKNLKSIQVLPGDLDRDQWLLNVQNGTINLRDGSLQPHARENRITKMAPVEYDPRATCPIWDAFLERIMAGKEELVEFLQRVVGYALTGDTGEEKLFILHGTGGNGKSKFIGAVMDMLGDYAGKTSTETFLDRKGTAPTNDLAGLKGLRFVSATEIAKGRRLNEALIKEITGRDPISCRFLYGEWFTYPPTYKLFLGLNHKPTLKSADEGIRRRLCLVPFSVTIPEAERDPNLPEKFKVELSGILNWAIAGCIAWQKQGLSEPGDVRASTQAYVDEMDPTEPFLSECCEVDPVPSRSNRMTPAMELRSAYIRFCEENGETPVRQKTFGSFLTDKGYIRQHTMYGWVWRGMSVKPERRGFPKLGGDTD